MRAGDFFVTSGEVLISEFAVDGSGDDRTISAQVEWTFPLDFVEVVWGDGKTVNRQIISTTDLAPHSSKRFRIPIRTKGEEVGAFRRVRFGRQRRSRSAGPFLKNGSAAGAASNSQNGAQAAVREGSSGTPNDLMLLSLLFSPPERSKPHDKKAVIRVSCLVIREKP